MIKKIFVTAAVAFSMAVFAQQTTHTVGKGDNPYNIAKKYGMTLEELLRLNPSAKTGKLNIGDKLTVKGKAAAKSNAKPVATPAASATTSSQLGYIILKPKQTLYSITKQYRISESEVRRLNPNLAMKIGERVSLPQNLISKYADSDAKNETYTTVSEPAPVRDTPVTKTQTAPAPTYTSTGVSQDDYITYTVQDGDTTFGIVNKFGISLDELIRLNPYLSSGLKPGMVLKVKKADKTFVKKNDDALNVVLMLPFGYNSGDSKYRSMSLDFLSGAKLAIERNAAKGQKLNVRVVDAGNEQTFKNSLTQINKDNTDLIIGPLFKSSVIEVLDYVGDNKIPVVAPFANSSDLYKYNNLIIVETNEQTYADRIVKEVKDVYSNQKIYIVADSDRKNANYLKAGLEKAVNNPNIIIVNSPQDIQPDNNMMTGQTAPVIAVLASNDENVGNAFSSRMIEMSRETQGIRAFSMYYVSSFERKVDELSQANLVYLMDRKINTEGQFEKEIMADFREKYCKSPGKYAVIGFDVVNDMLSRENNRGEIFRQIDKSQTQLATKFEFVRAERNGAYINTGYRVVRLVP